MGDIQHNVDYLDDARSRLPEQFKNLPRIDALLQAFSAEAQLLEDTAYTVLVDRIYQNNLAVGDLLDKLGAIVGQPRQGFSDADYHTLIGARIKANRSDGKRETLIAITRILAAATLQVVVREYAKAIEIEADAVALNAFIIWRDFLNIAKPAGTSLRFIASSSTSTNVLTRSSVSGGVSIASTQQKGSVHGGGGTGVFAAAYG